MIPWGALVALAGQATSGIMSAINNKKQREQDAERTAKQEAYYRSKANENPLTNSANQQVINQYDRSAEKQIDTAKNVAKITGATPEYGQAVQQSIAEGRAALMGSIAGKASQREDTYENKAEAVREAKDARDADRLAQRQQTYANLAANAANAFGGILDSYSTKVSEGKEISSPANKKISTPIASNKELSKVGVTPNVPVTDGKVQMPKIDATTLAKSATDGNKPSYQLAQEERMRKLANTMGYLPKL